MEAFAHWLSHVVLIGFVIDLYYNVRKIKSRVEKLEKEL